MKKSVLIGAGALALAIAPNVAQAAPVDNALGAANGIDAVFGADDLPAPTPDPDPNVEGGQDRPQPEAPEFPDNVEDPDGFVDEVPPGFEGGEEPIPHEERPEVPLNPEPTPSPEPGPTPTPEPNPGVDQPVEDPGANQPVPLVPVPQPQAPAEEEVPPSSDSQPDLLGDVTWDLDVEEEANEVYEDGVSRSQLPSEPITPATSVTETQTDITLAETGGTFAFFLAGSTFLLVGGGGAVMASRAIRRSKPHT
ncbi:MAG: hypothetical protein Q4C87_06540 [Actinomycetaceae bacterium]|nr:hypothetical protein [Actinomycetaceae bacterium]